MSVCSFHGVTLMGSWGNYKCPVCVVNEIRVKEKEEDKK